MSDMHCEEVLYCDSQDFAMLVLANFVASTVNRLSLFGQRDDKVNFAGRSGHHT